MEENGLFLAKFQVNSDKIQIESITVIDKKTKNSLKNWIKIQNIVGIWKKSFGKKSVFQNSMEK